MTQKGSKSSINDPNILEKVQYLKRGKRKICLVCMQSGSKLLILLNTIYKVSFIYESIPIAAGGSTYKSPIV